MSCNFVLCNDISCNSYCAAGVFYVSLDTFRSIFQFQTSEITNSALPNSALSNVSADITHYVNASLMPIINPAHAMMDASGSQGIIFSSPTDDYRLLKHDYLYYIAEEIFGSYAGVTFWKNIKNLKENIEELGWSTKNSIEQKLNIAYNSGNGMSNGINSSNLTKRLLEQISYHDLTRFNVGSNQNNRIEDISSSQAVPFTEGDTISYYFTILKDNILSRKYRIILHLTEDSSKINTVPIDSVSSDVPAHAYINNNGVP